MYSYFRGVGRSRCTYREKGLENIIHILVEEVSKGVLHTTEKLMLFLKKNLE